MASSYSNMNNRGWSARVVVRYTLYQVPAMALLVLIVILVRQFVNIPAWLSWGLIVLWVAKDVVLFPFVWRAYDSDKQGSVNRMVGARGIAKDRLAPAGYIRVRGELWLAEVMGGGPPIEAGEVVRVQGMRGLTLLVQPEDKEGRRSSETGEARVRPVDKCNDGRSSGTMVKCCTTNCGAKRS